MKIFGISIGLDKKPKSTSDKILNLIDARNNAPSGFICKDISVKLRVICLRNPRDVAQIIFDNNIDSAIKNRLLFVYSSDHWGSSGLADNPQWTQMIINFVIPRLTELPYETRIRLEWYFKDCPVDINNKPIDYDALRRWVYQNMRRRWDKSNLQDDCWR